MSSNEQNETFRCVSGSELAALNAKIKGYSAKPVNLTKFKSPMAVPNTDAVRRAARQVADYVSVLYDNDDIIEVRILPSGASVWLEAGELARRVGDFVSRNGNGQDIYAGVNPRKQHGLKGDESVLLTRCIFADFDRMTVDEARQRIVAMGLPTPTLILNSGHGVHAYWRLSGSIADLAAWTELQKDLASHLGSDPVVVNPERIMRVPGFVNHKEPKAPCELVECDAARVYDLGQLRALIPARSNSASQAALMGETIGDGERNKTLTRLAGTMRRTGMGVDEMQAALLVVNQNRCDPPLPDHEVRRIAESVGRYAPAETKQTRASDGTSYVADPSGLVFVKPAKDGAGESSTWLTNFTAQIIGNVVEDDGAEQRRTFEIEAVLAGLPHRFNLPAEQFMSMNWALEQMGAGAIVHPGMGTKDRARHAIQMLSNPTGRTVYTHTGWRKIGDKQVYLHAGGAIGDTGIVGGVEVHLPDPLAGYLLPNPPTGDELVKCINASLKLIDLGPDDITVPLFCAAYRAPLGASDSAVYLAGPTGVFKSELAALGNQHFGEGLDARHLPGSWSGTENALEGLAFIAKDTLITIDDFAPQGGAHDVQKFHQKADRVLRAQGNRSGRARMRADGSLRPVKPPRGKIVGTGEDIPKGQSIRARMLVIEVGPKDISPAMLSSRQEDARAGLYAGAMAGYVRWLAGRIETVQNGMKSELAELRNRAAKSSMHRRTPDIVASLALGHRYFLSYAKDVGALTDAQAETLWTRGWQALGRVAERQTAHQAAMEPTRRFLELLAAALASGTAHLGAPEGGAPTRESETATKASGALWGWQNLEPGGEKIGWVDDQYVYLIPDAAFKAAQQMGGADGLSITSQTLWKRLHEKGLLIREPGRDELKVRKTLEGTQQKAIQIRRSCLMGGEPAKPTKPDSDRDSDAENED